MPYRDSEYILLRIFTKESRLQRKLEILTEMGFEGFTVLRGIAGYGTSEISSEDIVVESLDLPVVIEIFTTYEKFKEKQEKLKEVIPGLITIERAKLDP